MFYFAKKFLKQKLGTEVVSNQIPMIGLVVGSNEFLVGAMKELGVKVYRWIPDGMEPLCDVLSRLPEKPNFIHINEDLGRRYFPPDVPSDDLPLVSFYAIDIHLNFFWHKEVAYLVDVFFSSQRSYVERLKALNPQVYHLPWAIRKEVFYDDGRNRDIDISFVGVVDEYRKKRRNIIEAVKKHFNLEVFNGLTWEEMAEIYRRSKIVLNESIAGEVNFRYFEAMACGALLLTEDIKELYHLFIPNIHLVTYNPANLLTKVAYYLKNEKDRESIRIRGRDLVHRFHTEIERARSFLRIIRMSSKRRIIVKEEREKVYYFLLSRCITEPKWIENLVEELGDNFYGALVKGLFKGDLVERVRESLKEDDDFYKYILSAFHHTLLGRDEEAIRLYEKGIERALHGDIWKRLLLKMVSMRRVKDPRFLYLLGRLYEENGRIIERGYFKKDLLINPLFAADFYKIALYIKPDFKPASERLGVILAKMDPPISDISLEILASSRAKGPITKELEKMVFYTYIHYP